MNTNNSYLTNQETYGAAVGLAVKKCETLFQKTFILGMMGGIFISLGFFGSLIAMSGAEGFLSAGMTKIIGAIVFPIGLILTIIIGGDLFTGNVLTSVAFLEKQTTLSRVTINLIAVWTGNLVGAILTAYLIYLTSSANTDTTKVVINVAKHKLHFNNLEIIVSGFFCNILVALAVWGSLASKNISGKVLAIYLPVFLFIITGFQHCVANMFLFSYASLLQDGFNILTILNALIMASIGNWLSGGVFIPIVYWYLYSNKYPFSEQ